jgi:bacterioferritin-associated ferredoxin
MIICSCNMLSDRDVRRVVTGAGAQLLTAGRPAADIAGG